MYICEGFSTETNIYYIYEVAYTVLRINKMCSSCTFWKHQKNVTGNLLGNRSDNKTSIQQVAVSIPKSQAQGILITPTRHPKIPTDITQYLRYDFVAPNNFSPSIWMSNLQLKILNPSKTEFIYK